MKCLISIIVPIYNAEKYLDRCIESIVKQTYQNMEIILVDDGSQDRSLEKCREWERKDTRIRVIHQKNQGEAGARNTGLQSAKGEWVGFVDSDDYIETDMCEKLLYRVLNDGADIVGCEDVYEGEDGKFISQSHCESVVLEGAEQCILEFLKLRIPGGVCTKLIRKKLIDDYSIVFRKVKHGPDLLFISECYVHSNKVSLVGQPYYHYIEHCESICNAVKESKKFDKRILSTITSAAWLAPHITKMSEEVQREYRAYYSMKIVSVLIYCVEKHDVPKETMERLIQNLRKNIVFLLESHVYSAKYKGMAVGLCYCFPMAQYVYRKWKK